MSAVHARVVVAALALLAAFGAAGALGAQAAARASAPAALLDSLRPRIEAAVVSGQGATLDSVASRLRAAIATSEGARDPWIHHDLAYALHRQASALIVGERARDARPMLEEAVRAAGRARELGGGAHATALEGALTGQLAGASGMLTAMRVGPRAWRLLDSAIALAPNDPRAALLNGISRVNAPRAFGGGAEKGEAELRRAIRLYEGDPNRSPLPTWGRADAHIWLAIALEKLGRTAEARAELLRALELAPGHRWVTGELLPKLDRAR